MSHERETAELTAELSTDARSEVDPRVPLTHRSRSPSARSKSWMYHCDCALRATFRDRANRIDEQRRSNK